MAGPYKEWEGKLTAGPYTERERKLTAGPCTEGRRRCAVGAYTERGGGQVRSGAVHGVRDIGERALRGRG